MKMRNYFLLGGAIAMSLLASSCNKENDIQGAPTISLEPSTLTIENVDADSGTITVTSSRNWRATTTDSWIKINPSSGSASKKGQTVEISVLDNSAQDAYNRTGKVKFNIGTSSKTLTVIQYGPKGDPSANIIYGNDFDKKVVTSNTNLYDNFGYWNNAVGKGIENVTYACSGITARSSGASNSSSFTDTYKGSGGNNLFFAANTAWFRIANIALGSVTKFGLSFSATMTGGKVSSDHLKVYVSADSDKWVELSYTWGDENSADGKWYLASSKFSVPAGTSSLYIHFLSKTDDIDQENGLIRIDDVKLEGIDEEGTALDFSAGIAVEGENDNTSPLPPLNGTISEVVATIDNREVSIDEALVVALTKQSYVIADNTGYTYVYAGYNKTPTVAVGDKISISATKTTYNGVAELKDATTTTISTGNQVNHPESSIEDITSTFATFSAKEMKYISFKGVLTGTDDGKYNVEVEGSTQLKGSISQPVDALNISSKVNQVVTVKGYYIGTSNGYTSVIATEITVDDAAKFLNTNTARIVVGAAATTASFNIVSNVAWTIDLSAAGNTISNLQGGPLSGTGNATITLIFDANNDNGIKRADIVVSTAEEGIDPVTVALGQAAKSYGNEKTDELTTASFTATGSTYKAFSDVAGTSGAKYAGKTSKNTEGSGNAIQINGTASSGGGVGSGIITTTSGGKARRITITWATTKTSTNDLVVYGSHTAYEAAADLQDAAKCGTLLGSLKSSDSTKEIEIIDDFEYIGITSKGAVYIDKIQIVWEQTAVVQPDPGQGGGSGTGNEPGGEGE